MKVKIKTWDAMEAEYGLAPSGSVNIKYMFTEDMERDMPEDRCIELVGHTMWNGWSISKDMIEIEPMYKDEILEDHLDIADEGIMQANYWLEKAGV